MRIAIDRPEIESAVIEATSRLLGLPTSKVFISDFASDASAPERPFVSLRIVPSSEVARRGQVKYEAGLEWWRFAVSSSTDGAYTMTIDGDTWTHNAVGQTATQIRDALVALVSSTEYTAEAAGEISIEVKSISLGLRLMCESSDNLSLTQICGNTLKIVTRPTTLRLEARCVGYYSSTPTAANSGVDMAERLAVSLLDVEATESMRGKGIAINEAVVSDLSVVKDGFAELVGMMDANMIVNSAYITTMDNATAASFEWSE